MDIGLIIRSEMVRCHEDRIKNNFDLRFTSVLVLFFKHGIIRVFICQPNVGEKLSGIHINSI